MKLLALAVFAFLATAAMPQPKTIRVSWDPYCVPAGCSNAVVVVYKSTSLGTVWCPFKPTAYIPAGRTNGNVTVLPGVYRFYATVQAQPLGESLQSNTITNRVNP